VRVPLGEREFWIAGCEPGAEVVLPGLDGALGGISAVGMGWHELEIYRVFGKGLFHSVGAFVVQDKACCVARSRRW
jgi:hypothetical protein